MGTNTETVRERKRTKKLAEEIAQAAIDAIPPERDTELEVDFQSPGEGDPILMGDPTDIFEVAKKIVARNDFAKFTIKKNGEYIATKPFPYSIEQLQRECGPGSYLIYLKEGSTGRIVKQQTIQIADAPVQEPKTMPQFAFDGSNGMGMEAGSKTPTFMEVFLMNNEREDKYRLRYQELEAKMEAKQREIEARLKEADRYKESSSTETMKMFMTMIQENAKNLQMVMMDSQKSQVTLLTSLLSKPKDEGLKAHELAKMLGDAEKNGYSRWKDISEMIDKKAESRAEEIAAQSGEGDESLTKTLIKGFIPLISQAVSSGALTPAPAAPTPQQIQATDLARKQAEYDKVQLENKKLAQRREYELKRARAMAAAQKTGVTPQPTSVKPSEVNDLPTPRETMNGKFKDHIQSLVLPVIAEDYGNKVSGVESASKCLSLLATKQISRKDVLDNFKLQDIMGLVETYGLPPETVPWFKEFYAALSGERNVNETTRTSPGQPSQDYAGPTT